MNKQEILKMFVSDDELREWMTVPWNWKGRVGATNGHILVLIPGEEAEYSTVKTDIEVVFPKNITERWTIDVEALSGTIKSIPEGERVIREENCDECFGDCRCSHCNEGKCPNCDGTGKVKVYPPNTKIRIRNTVFAVRYLEIVLKVAEMLGNVQIELSYDGNVAHAHWIMFNDGVRVILMPMRQDIYISDGGKEYPLRLLEVKP
jgi:hypothetical protein